jgi:hypothetical protein
MTTVLEQAELLILPPAGEKKTPSAPGAYLHSTAPASGVCRFVADAQE